MDAMLIKPTAQSTLNSEDRMITIPECETPINVSDNNSQDEVTPPRRMPMPLPPGGFSISIGGSVGFNDDSSKKAKEQEDALRSEWNPNDIKKSPMTPRSGDASYEEDDG